MAQSNIRISDAHDSTSNTTVDSEEEDIECNVAQIKSTNLDLPTSILNVPDKTSIAHISSIALQNSTDITFGNKLLYNGPITVNQYGVETTPPKADVIKRRWKILLTVAIIIIASILIPLVTIVTLRSRNGNDDTDGIFNIDNDHTPLRLVSREKWRAKEPTGDVDDLITPVPLVIVQHTVTPSCDTMETCAVLVRQIQISHISNEEFGDDIGYNFLVGGDGAAYVGRGWDKLGAHTRGYNGKSLGVAFIGDFREDAPTNQQVVALLKLLRDGVAFSKISENYTLIGANQVKQTESPGKMVFQILTKLTHWSDDIDCKWNFYDENCNS